MYIFKTVLLYVVEAGREAAASAASTECTSCEPLRGSRRGSQRYGGSGGEWGATVWMKSQKSSEIERNGVGNRYSASKMSGGTSR